MKMCHVINDPSDNVQRMAYKMLCASATKYTEHLVLEAAVDSDAELKLELPLELVSLLQMSLPEEDTEGNGTIKVINLVLRLLRVLLNKFAEHPRFSVVVDAGFRLIL